MKKQFVSLCLLTVFALPIASNSALAAPGDGVAYPNAKPDAKTQVIIKEREQLEKMYEEAAQGKRSVSEVKKAFADFKVRHGLKTTNSNDTTSPSLSTPQTVYPASATVSNLTQQSQIKNYYCGPATVSELLNAQSIYKDQSTVAVPLQTEQNQGTNWSNSPTSFPVADTLNSYMGGTYYYASAAPSLSTFTSTLKFDITNGFGIAADIAEVYNGYHLPGHPNTTSTIWHWLAINGYGSNGDTTTYVDSASGGTGISWNTTAPTGSVSSSNMVTLVSARGIIK